MISFQKLFALLDERGYQRQWLDDTSSHATIYRMYRGEIVTTKVINGICEKLNCQPGDIMEYIPDEVPKEG